jgi:hypothetical protein
MMIKLFTYAIDKPETFNCALHINADNSANLLFQQCLEYKSLVMLQCDFSLETDDKIKMHIKYRNKLAKIEFEEMNARLQNVCAII